MTSRTLTDYLSDARRLERDPKSGAAVRISIAASFTAKGLKEILTVTCADAGIPADVYDSGYNEHWQDLLNPSSALYAHNPDLIILFLDIRDILGEQYWAPYQISSDDRLRWVDTKFEELRSFIETVKQHSQAKVLVHNFEVPVYSPLGILEEKQLFGIRETIQTLNARLRDIAKNDSRLFIFNYDLFCSNVGKANTVDPKMYYLGDVRLQWTQMPALCGEYLAFIQPLASRIHKCIVLDLDNTLWGGIAGEDGIEGIHLGPTPEGRPYWEFQKLLRALWQRGVILAINSRNNPGDALRVLREHPFMVLREDDFAAMRINWEDKAENLVELADELRLGLDSFVFIDDDRAARDRIRSAFPDVFVVDLPGDAALYPTTLMNLKLFNTFQVTEEDQGKGRAYEEQRRRREHAASAMSYEDHLASLQTVVTMMPADSSNIPRISQLTQKTNQFNMTTRRYLEEDIARFARDAAYLVVCCRVQDKFGDNGITGVAIVEKASPSWRIDTFLLSCRVIGRGVEGVMLSHIIDQARNEGATALIGEFISTAKNAPARDFYKRNGFTLDRTGNGIERSSLGI